MHFIKYINTLNAITAIINIIYIIMKLYTDDNPITTLKGLGFKDKNKALETINIVEKYFNQMNKNQKIPGYTPNNVLPRKYISNKKESNKYYLLQKKYRILGMRNRGVGMLKKVSSNKNILDAIKIFNNWLKIETIK